MKLKNNQYNYSFMAKVFHWGFVILFIYGVSKRVDNLSQLQDLSFLRFEMAFATFFLLLLFIRFIYMKKTQRTSLPINTPKSQIFAAKLVHHAMYILLALTALSGLLIGLFYSQEINQILLMEIIIYFHELVVNLLYVFIFIHIIAASYHRLKKDGVWSSMVPFLKEKN